MEWPPSILYEYFDVPLIVQTCKDRCHINDTKEIESFERSENFQNLPNSSELRCYLHCNMIESGILEPGSVKMNISKMVDVLTDDRLSLEQRSIIMGLGKGCLQKTKKYKDPIEFSYQLAVCAKQNDNEVLLSLMKTVDEWLNMFFFC